MKVLALDFLNSKKFWIMLITVISLAAVDLLEHGTLTPDAINRITAVIITWLTAQGVADFGKNRPQG